MPKVGKKKFPYTKKGKEAAKKAANSFLNDHGRSVQRKSEAKDYEMFDVQVCGYPLHQTDKMSMDHDPLYEYLDNEAEERPEPEEYESGWIYVYQEPEEGGVYIIGVDPSEGTGNDYAAFAVRRGGELVCCGYRNDLSTDVLAMYLETLGRWYNNATLHIERAGGGLAVINTLIRLAYSNLYGTEEFDEYGEPKGRRVGFTPTVESVKSLLAMFRHELNTGTFRLKHPRLIMECGWIRRVVRRRPDDTLVAEWRTPGKGREMPSGERLSDDLFRAAALTLMPNRDIEWISAMELEQASVQAPAAKAKTTVGYEFHNPLWKDESEPMLVQQGEYDVIDISPTLDDDEDMPVP
jgi:hypothetical protein